MARRQRPQPRYLLQAPWRMPRGMQPLCWSFESLGEAGVPAPVVPARARPLRPRRCMLPGRVCPRPKTPPGTPPFLSYWPPSVDAACCATMLTSHCRKLGTLGGTIEPRRHRGVTGRPEMLPQRGQSGSNHPKMEGPAQKQSLREAVTSARLLRQRVVSGGETARYCFGRDDEQRRFGP